uniref:Longin domain-containing protein n=1 Tax=Angiostrongylus cantonensis TaxID=6313 RepID=A0A0K0DMR3_ANGCA
MSNHTIKEIEGNNYLIVNTSPAECDNDDATVTTQSYMAAVVRLTNNFVLCTRLSPTERQLSEHFRNTKQYFMDVIYFGVNDEPAQRLRCFVKIN